jgi:hypothetical protein
MTTALMKSERKTICPAVWFAFSLSPAPNMRAAKEPAPTPVPTPNPPKIIWMGKAMVTAAMVWGPSRESQKTSTKL